MNRKRWFGFIAIILIGLAAGLVYGWVIHPAQVGNTTLDTLRSDYKADYVLMVSETYLASADLDQAKKDLEAIDPANPLRAVQTGLITAQSLGYPTDDLQMMAQLEAALSAASPATQVTP